MGVTSSEDLATGAPPPGEDPSTGPRHARTAARKGGSFFKELPFLVIIAFLLALLIKAFLVQAFYIPSGSMQQTLELRDRVLVNKLVYDFRDIHRGEVVVFNGLDSFTPETQIAPATNGLAKVLRSVSSAIGVGAPGEKDFIKRVIGVPGDRVACCTDGKVTVQPEGAERPVALEEPYVFEDDRMAFCSAGTGDVLCPPGAEGVLVPEGRLWVMGDHRGSSSDSRFHIEDENQGTVPQDKVIGRAFVIVWPLDRATVLSVPDTFDGALGALPAYGLVATPYALGLVGALPLVALKRRLRLSPPRRLRLSPLRRLRRRR
ncbi:MAG: signal peptidase [Frankiales bacterium]|nr:signal peptidase [Frankiales bacterium]